MKKILASILAAFFVVLSPISAYAATTESMMMFSSGSGSDEYAVMPLSAVSNTFNFSVYSGVYQRFDDSFSLNELDLGIKSSGSVVSDLDWYGLNYFSDYISGFMPMFAFSIGDPSSSSSFSIPNNSTLNIYINDFYSDLWSESLQKAFALSPQNAVPYRVFADMHFTAMKQVGSTHTATYHNQTVELTNFAVPASVPYDSAWAFDVNMSIPVIADQSNIDSNIDRLYSINLRYIRVYVVYDFSQYLLNDYSGIPLRLDYGDRLTYKLAFRNFGDSQLTSRISVTYLEGSSDSALNSGVSGIQSSVSALNTNVTNQISQVKSQITQSTNTITTKIDTMGSDIQQGLQNVVQSAQQNTQNIINTVTQKVDEVKTGITEVKDSILDLPNKIQEMLLGLIVPDSDTMADKYSEFSGLLEEKLGVIYQIPMMLFDFFDTIVNAATTPQSTLTLPAFRLPWIDGSQLTIWNSMEYKIIPDGLEVLSDLIRTVTSMTVVVLTFNSVKQAYERFLRS